MSGRREQQVSTSLGRHRVSLPRARSVDFGAVSAPVSESATHYSGFEEERSFYPREVSGTKSIQRQSSIDSETASASQRSTCSPSSLYSLTSPCLDLQPRPSRQASVGTLTRTASRQSTEGITGRQLREVERSEEDGEPLHYLNGAEVRISMIKFAMLGRRGTKEHVEDVSSFRPILYIRCLERCPSFVKLLALKKDMACS